MGGLLILLMQMAKLEQEPELDELCEIIAGLELIQRCAQDGRSEDMVVNESLDAMGAIAADLIAMVRSLDETNIFDLEKIQEQMRREI